MKNLMNHYAKQLLFVVGLIYAPNLLFAQNKPMKYPGNKTEQKEGKADSSFTSREIHTLCSAKTIL